MNITNIRQKDNYKNPTFKHEIFVNLKNLPGMTCAICGKPTLSNNLYQNTIKSLSKPLSYNLETNRLNFLKNKYPKLWDKFVELAKTFPKLSLDEILFDKKDVCNEVGEIFNNSFDTDFNSLNHYDAIIQQRKIQEIYFNILDAAHAEMKQSSVVIKQLQKLKNYLDDIKAETFEQFETKMINTSIEIVLSKAFLNIFSTLGVIVIILLVAILIIPTVYDIFTGL
jgi:hypothetical protein